MYSVKPGQFLLSSCPAEAYTAKLVLALERKHGRMRVVESFSIEGHKAGMMPPEIWPLWQYILAHCCTLNVQHGSALKAGQGRRGRDREWDGHVWKNKKQNKTSITMYKYKKIKDASIRILVLGISWFVLVVIKIHWYYVILCHVSHAKLLCHANKQMTQNYKFTISWLG